MKEWPRFEKGLEGRLREMEALHLKRTLRIVEGAQMPEVRVEGRSLIHFASNDYLGFADDERIREAALEAIDHYGVGAGASRLICGTLRPHRVLEEILADFKRTEAALVFSSGYALAIGVLPALIESQDVVILDKLCHASLIDGARWSGAKIRVFPHQDLNRLQAHLQWARQQHPRARVWVVTESVFSMDGDVTPLAEIVALKEQYGAYLVVDEAHAVGLFGTWGEGCVAAAGLTDRVEVQLGTLGKSLGSQGGYVCGCRLLIDFLIQRARSFFFSTAPLPACAAAATAAIRLLMSGEAQPQRQQLQKNLQCLVSEMKARDGGQFLRASCPVLSDWKEGVVSAIVPLMIGESDKALLMAQELWEQGFWVPAIRFPSVPKKSARLRLTLTARHTPLQVHGVVKALLGPLL